MFRFRYIKEILRESVSFAWTSLKTNAMRSILSMLGIIIGIFTIISILTFVTSLDHSVRSSVSKLGGDVIYIQKWPWVVEGEYPWWKFLNRPEAKYQEMVLVKRKLDNYSAIAFGLNISNKALAYNKEQFKRAVVTAYSYDFIKIFDVKFQDGRYFTDEESKGGQPKIIIGYNIAKSLFNGEDPIDKTIKVFNKKLKVIGVLEKDGNNAVNINNFDNAAIVPLNFIRYLYGSDLSSFDPMIIVKGKNEKEVSAMEGELRGIMRSIRRLSPYQEDDFSLNKIDLLNDRLNVLFKSLGLAGWIIAAFSILVGGFGTANIMFVTVKERTSLIGIEKALGAPRYYILSQFLGEAIILCLIGGAIGMILVTIGILIVNSFSDLQLILTIKNVLIGLSLSMFIGIIAGFIPAYQASRLDPINAIRNRF
jgi:putative ABC transport system permease protein